MSVSISPRCSRRCAHRGGGGAGDEIEGMCCFFVHHSVFPPPPVCVPSPTPLLISEEKGGECNQDMREWWGGGLWNCLQGNKRMVDWQRVQPSFSTFCRVCPAPPHPSPLSRLLRSPRFTGAIRSLLPQYLVILRPSGPSRSNPHSRTMFVKLCQPFLCSQRLNAQV